MALRVGTGRRFGAAAITQASPSPEPPISCAYPLDGDSTIPTMFGFGYAGPAVGENQQSIEYTRVGGVPSDAALLMASDPFGVDSFDLPESGNISVEYAIADAGGDETGLAILWHDGGSFTGLVSQSSSTNGARITAVIASDGTVTMKVDGVDGNTSSIPAGQKWAPYLSVQDYVGAPTTQVTGTLYTDAADIEYGSGTDPCGNPIS